MSNIKTGGAERARTADPSDPGVPEWGNPDDECRLFTAEFIGG